MLRRDQEAQVIFVPANWDGAEMEEGDLALDIDAGGKGLKGLKDPDGTVHSCFASIIEQYAPERDKMALAHLVRFVDMQDSRGSVVNNLLPDVSRDVRAIFAVTGLGSVLRALQAIHQKDHVVFNKMAEILDGMLKIAHARQYAQADANRAERLPNGVWLVRNSSEVSTTNILFERGAQAVVFVDGHNIGVLRRNGLSVRADHDAVRQVVAEKDELDEWYAHPSGFLFARGTRKSPATTASKVDPRRLAHAVAEAIREMDSYKALGQ